MKTRRCSNMWLYFALIIFVIMLVTAIIMTVLAFLLFRLGHFSYPGGHPLPPIVFLLFISVLIGTAISLFVGRKILKPVTKLSEAAREVAKGNFDIRMDETNRIAELRDMSQSFNLMVQELYGIETLRKDFVDNVSHEFRTPLASITGYATLLQDKSLSEPERDEYIKMILESSGQLSALSENILNLSRLENQEMTLDKQSFRLDEQIREAVLMLEHKWSAADIELEIDLDRVTYHGNKGLLMQVWINLIDNAVKFTDRGGRIEIHLRQDTGGVIVEVRDNGRGMSRTELLHIFEKFYQADGARKKAGNGLGLALVRRIMDLCGGKIDVESLEGKGSVFSVTLPS